MRDVDPLRIRDLLGTIAEAQAHLRELGQLAREWRAFATCLCISIGKSTTGAFTKSPETSWATWIVSGSR